MKKTGLIYIIAIGLFMSMCTARKPLTRSYPTPVPTQEFEAEATPTAAAMGYTGDREATFYYTEGLKWSELHNDRVRASRFFDRAIEADSTHSPSYFAAASNLAPVDAELALQYSRKANELDTANVWYRTQMASLQVMNRQYQDAMSSYNRLVHEAPDNPENYRMLAALYEVTNQPYVSLAILDSAETKFGRLEQLTGYKRQLYLKLNMMDRAVTTSQVLINEYPFQYENYLVLGDLYMAQRRDSLAFENLRKAQALNPEGVDVMLSLANYYRVKGEADQFFNTTRRILQSDAMAPDKKVLLFKDITRDRDFYGAHYFQISSLAQTLMLKYPTDYQVVDLYAGNLLMGGQTEDGLNVYKRYLSDTTSFVEPFDMILSGEAFLGRTDSVDKYSLMAIAKFPDNPDLHLRRGSALVFMKRYDEALATYETALKMANTDSLKSVVHCSIGDLYHELGKSRQCFANYDKALRFDPDNVLTLNNYAYFLSLEEKELDKALEMAERVMKLEPGNSTYIDTYGWVLYKLGRYEEAKKVVQQAISLDTTASKELLVHYGDILYELDDHFMARYYWQKALEAGYDARQVEERMSKLDAQ